MEHFIIAWLNSAIPPISLALGLRYSYHFYTNRFSAEAIKNAKSNQKKWRKVQFISLIFPLVLGLSIVLILTLSLIGISVFQFRCFQNPGALPSIFIICALISTNTFDLRILPKQISWLIFGFTEVVLGLTAYGGFLVISQLPTLLGAGAFYAVLFFGSAIGLWIRSILFKTWRV